MVAVEQAYERENMKRKEKIVKPKVDPEVERKI